MTQFTPQLDPSNFWFANPRFDSSPGILMDGLSPGLMANFRTGGSPGPSESQFASLLDLNRIETLNAREPPFGAGSNSPGIPPGGINREEEYRVYDGRGPLYSPPPQEGADAGPVSREGESIAKQSPGVIAGETASRKELEEPGRRVADRPPPGAGRNGKTPNAKGRETPVPAEKARERGDAEGAKSGELKSLKENARANGEETATEAAELLLAAEVQISEKTVLTGTPDEAANTGEDFHEMALEGGAGEGTGSEAGVFLARTGEETGDSKALQETRAGSAAEALSRSAPSETESAGNKAEEPAQKASPARGEGAEAPLNPAAANAVLASAPREQGHKPSGEGRGEEGERTGETRKGDRRKDRLNLELRDFRTTRNGNEKAAPEAVENSRSGGEGEPRFGRETEITVDLKSQARSQAEISFERENRPQESFRNMLARELHENLNGDIVRHASIMLKDGGEGIIRLALRPEHLGNVKIRLEMTENKITGRIIVESNEALRAFEQEIGSLEQAFRDSGFDGASLEMSVASGSGQESKGRQQEGEEASPGPYFSERLTAASYDASYGGNSNADGLSWFNGAYGQSLPQVNVLV